MKTILLLMVLAITISCSEDSPALSSIENNLVGEWYLDSAYAFGSTIPTYSYPGNLACHVTLTAEPHSTGHWTTYGAVGGCTYSEVNIWWVNPATDLLRDQYSIDLTATHLTLSKLDGSEIYYYSN